MIDLLSYSYFGPDFASEFLGVLVKFLQRSRAIIHFSSRKQTTQQLRFDELGIPSFSEYKHCTFESRTPTTNSAFLNIFDLQSSMNHPIHTPVSYPVDPGW